MPNREGGPDDPVETEWTQQELQALHGMVQDYIRMEWLKQKAWKWGLAIVSVPASVLYFWEPLVRLWKLLKGGGP